MSVISLTEDSLALYKERRFLSALCLAMITIEATAHKCYGSKRSSKYISSPARRFKRFLNDENKPTNLMMRIYHGVDLPRQPNLGDMPRYRSPSNADDFTETENSFKNFRKAMDEWYSMETRVYEEYDKKIIRVGDNFCGKYETIDNPGNTKRKRRWVSYLGVPRFVTTTGILYQVRCELIHEGSLTTIRLVSNHDDSRLRVRAGNPIELSPAWVPFILGIVACAKENHGMQLK